MERGDYKKALSQRQERLNLVQQAMLRQGERGIILFEGWDASGKGSTIRRIAWCLDPRTLHVWQISAPTPTELDDHWLRRFWTRIPARGEIAIFDRSWYGRVLVERIEGFATEEEWNRAYREINEFESSLADEGYRIVKLFLNISQETQLQRFKQRLEVPTKRWKLTPDDIRNRSKWEEYENAYSKMIEACSPDFAPWHKINANSKKNARLACLDHIIASFSQGLNIAPPNVDPVVREYLKDPD